MWGAISSVYDGFSTAYNKIMPYATTVGTVIQEVQTVVNHDRRTNDIFNAFEALKVPPLVEAIDIVCKEQEHEVSIENCDPMSWVVSLALAGAIDRGRPKFKKIAGGVVPTWIDDVGVSVLPTSAKEIILGVKRRLYTTDSRKEFSKYADFIPIVSRVFPLRTKNGTNKSMKKIWKYAMKGLDSALETSYKGNEDLLQMKANIKILLAKGTNKIPQKTESLDADSPAILSLKSRPSPTAKNISIDDPNFSLGSGLLNASASTDLKPELPERSYAGSTDSTDSKHNYREDEKGDILTVDIPTPSERATESAWTDKLVKIKLALEAVNMGESGDRFSKKIVFLDFMKRQGKEYIARRQEYAEDVLSLLNESPLEKSSTVSAGIGTSTSTLP